MPEHDPEKRPPLFLEARTKPKR